MTHRYCVKLPVVGHAVVLVDAENEESAIDKAMIEVNLIDIENWETIRRFNQGNICYCPQPWEVEVTLDDMDE